MSYAARAYFYVLGLHTTSSLPICSKQHSCALPNQLLLRGAQPHALCEMRHEGVLASHFFSASQAHAPAPVESCRIVPFFLQLSIARLVPRWPQRKLKYYAEFLH